MSVIAGIVNSVVGVADELFTSDEERARVELERYQIEASLVKGQLDVNAQEAKHKSVFVAGWRPFVGWIGGAALAYQFLLYPLLLWLVALAQGGGYLSEFEAPPVLDADVLFSIVTAMLGIAGMRSYDKSKRTQTDRIK
mgnify:CR=1 FL=1|tara:strand:- start:23980 stop:24396 length:417 start_codon:yes stop_codon:yes gene_type:complete